MPGAMLVNVFVFRWKNGAQGESEACQRVPRKLVTQPQVDCRPSAPGSSSHPGPSSQQPQARAPSLLGLRRSTGPVALVVLASAPPQVPKFQQLQGNSAPCLSAVAPFPPECQVSVLERTRVSLGVSLAELLGSPWGKHSLPSVSWDIFSATIISTLHPRRRCER